MNLPRPLPAPRLLGEPRCIWPAEAELGEGTLWSARDEALYWVDILGKQLHRLRPSDGARTSWRFDEEISAAAERASEPGLIVTVTSAPPAVLKSNLDECLRQLLMHIPAKSLPEEVTIRIAR